MPFAIRLRDATRETCNHQEPGVGHHPHSLVDPSPIVDFVLDAVEKSHTRR
jgi:hypothetical protein